MGKIGWGEFLVILVILLLVVGPDKMPKLAQSLGKAIRSVKKYVNETAKELESIEELKGVKEDLQSIQKDVTAMGKELEKSAAVAGAQVMDFSGKKEEAPPAEPESTDATPVAEEPAEETVTVPDAPETEETTSETDNT